MAEPFGGGEAAYLAGLFHDIGKFNPAFQAYLRAQHAGRPHPIVPHAVWGSALVYRLLTQAPPSTSLWKQVALPIYGHHAGLPAGGTLAQVLEEFLGERPDALPSLAPHIRALPSLPLLSRPVQLSPVAEELCIRMLFSALVDADFLDTERHFRPERESQRAAWPALDALWELLEASQRERIAHADPTAMNRLRREVYEACLAAADGAPGIYRLTVPTGGGKTLSGLAFALRHALVHGLRRVVVAAPYTSIIDQTAEVYRGVLGPDAVLEHHSQLAVPEDESEAAATVQQRLATENWDAPLIVTTTVQLLESLFAARPSRVRKLHNLARSVILLDEVQTLPPGLLEPTADVLRELVASFGTTVVLSTATQPALEDTPYLRAFRGVTIREIVPDHPRHFRVAARVEYCIESTPRSWQEVAAAVGAERQILVVLNARKDALAVLGHLRQTDGTYHLSTLLCGAHRRAILADVRRKLLAGDPVRLVSTQVVEAGVDLDFPVVWRAIGPLDRIVQAAGRCNREGLRATGTVVIFHPADGRAPRGPYRVGIQEAQLLLRDGGPDTFHDPAAYRRYFQRLFSLVRLDEKGIQGLRRALDYRAVARMYRLIEDDTVPVVVPYGDAERYLAGWQADPTRATWRQLQPYLVNLYASDAHRPEIATHLQPVSETVYWWRGPYDDRTGIGSAISDPADLDTERPNAGH